MPHKGKKKGQFLNAFTMSQNPQWFSENTDQFYQMCKASHTEPPQLTAEPARIQPGSKDGVGMRMTTGFEMLILLPVFSLITETVF